MKQILTLTAIATIFVAAISQMGHTISKNAKHVTTCPVTGDRVDMDRAMKNHLYADYKGNRYFFCCSDCPPKFNANPAKYANKPHIKIPGVQKATIVVDSGFKPSRITVKSGQPVELTFDTKHRGCATSVIFKDLHITKALVDGKKTIVTFTPKKPGTIGFACPMDMFKGVVVVK